MCWQMVVLPDDSGGYRQLPCQGQRVWRYLRFRLYLQHFQGFAVQQQRGIFVAWFISPIQV
jgi:hypothetical protein